MKSAPKASRRCGTDGQHRSNPKEQHHEAGLAFRIGQAGWPHASEPQTVAFAQPGKGAQKNASTLHDMRKTTRLDLFSFAFSVLRNAFRLYDLFRRTMQTMAVAAFEFIARTGTLPHTRATTLATVQAMKQRSGSSSVRFRCKEGLRSSRSKRVHPSKSHFTRLSAFFERSRFAHSGHQHPLSTSNGFVDHTRPNRHSHSSG